MSVGHAEPRRPLRRRWRRDRARRREPATSSTGRRETLTQWALPSAPEVDLVEVRRRRSSRATRRATARRSRCSCATRRVRARGAAPATRARSSSSSTAAPRARRRPASAATRSSSSTPASSSSSPTCAAATATARRGSTPTTAPKRLDVITDIEDAGKRIRASWVTRTARRRRSAIIGGSYGGYSALMGMTMFAGAYDAGVSIVGISNLLDVPAEHRALPPQPAHRASTAIPRRTPRR